MKLMPEFKRGGHDAFRRAFTLVELLCVVSLITLLVLVVGIAIPGTLASQRLSTAARQLAADLNDATLIARKKNLPVELCFYKLPPNEAMPEGASSATFRAYRFGVVTGWNEQAEPIVEFKTELQYLPEGVVFMPGANHSPLLETPQKTADLKRAGLNAVPVASYYLRSNGDATLNKEEPLLFTLVGEVAGEAPRALPVNYRCVVVEAQKHVVSVY